MGRESDRCSQGAPTIPLLTTPPIQTLQTHRSEKQNVNAFLDGAGPTALRWFYQVCLCLEGCVVFAAPPLGAPC